MSESERIEAVLAFVKMNLEDVAPEFPIVPCLVGLLEDGNLQVVALPEGEADAPRAEINPLHSDILQRLGTISPTMQIVFLSMKGSKLHTVNHEWAGLADRGWKEGPDSS